ncbi:D-alanine--D-alanine ligase [Aldersonia sp. NBC_00410]|uniref:D-alanine--D-alanine ligase family protein n=1 Tax=Aldersonia sp. NBC_00410 TaxID=2975954 RepID=UPI0022576EB7|nr:D-alanine--D-alanine ligase family protein [Aldersonia sp. NBC_00410]MCX5046140.1 D-alanine--D-alanine ligase [Aldersonia sp. NBC_00410]
MVTNRIRVGVLYGGRSNEHSVSCVSAGSVLRHLDPDRYEPVPIGITAAGTWLLGTRDPRDFALVEGALPTVEQSGVPVALSTDPGQRGALVAIGDGITDRVVERVDVIFPVLHGAYGEDGTVQGLLELADVPYVGPGVLASAVAMDKEFTKKLLGAAGLPIGTQFVLRAGAETLTDEQRRTLGLPVFVKPARGGSSIGISRVSDWADLEDAITTARKHDPKVIIEAEIPGSEVECGVLEYPDGRVEASVVAEIRMPLAVDDGTAFYDFDSKYLDDVCEFDVPAKLDDETSGAIRAIAVQAFRALDCTGLARVDFFVTAQGPVISEINTMPGFTAISMYPRMFDAAGVDYRTLVSTLIETALARGTGLR